MLIDPIEAAAVVNQIPSFSRKGKDYRDNGFLIPCTVFEKIVLDFRWELWYWFVLQGGDVYATQATRQTEQQKKNQARLWFGCPDLGRALSYEGV